MKRITKRILASTAVLLTVCIILTIVYNNKTVVEAVPDSTQATLPGIEMIVEENSSSNPYVFYEVVSAKADASLGYLVGGEEPIGIEWDSNGNVISNGKSLRDMPVSYERILAMRNFEASSTASAYGAAFSIGDPYNEAGNDYSYEIRGTLPKTADGEYYYSDVPNVYEEYNAATDKGKTRYNRYFETVAGTEYSVSFGTFSSTSDLNIKIDGTKYKQYYRYSIVANSLESANTNTWLEAYNGGSSKHVYARIIDGASNSYTYVGSVDISGNDPTTGDPLIALKTTSGKYKSLSKYATGEYVTLSLTPSHTEGDYVISSVKKSEITNTDSEGNSVTSSAGNYSLDLELYVEEENGSYVRIERVDNGLIYSPQFETLEYTALVGNDYTKDKDTAERRTFVSDYSGALVSNVSYSGGIVNSEWLKKYTFDIKDDKISSFVLDVKPITVTELDNLQTTKCSALYLNSASEDMSLATAKAIITDIKENKLPVILEKGFADTSKNSVNSRLAILLQNPIDSISASDMDRTEASFWSDKRLFMKSGDFYVNNSVLVYNGNFVASDFITKLAESAYKSTTSGLYPVYEEIISENFYRNNASKGALNHSELEVSKATALRYIINYANKRVVVKNEIKVLEIEPCYSFDNYTLTNSDNGLLKVRNYADNRTITIENDGNFRQVLSTSYIANNWATQFIDSESNITLVQMYSKEFIGKVENLNEEYDLIYIGTDTSTMDTEITTTGYGWDTRYYKSPTATKYNDSTMDGLIYSHVGDIMNDTHKSNLKWEDKYPGVTQERLSGNDITLTKLRELKTFILAGYPVVFADNFFTYDAKGKPSAVNTVAIDVNSNMYKLGQFVLGNEYVEEAASEGKEAVVEKGYGRFIGNNVFYKSEIAGNADVQRRLSDYLNISKLKVDLALRRNGAHNDDQFLVSSSGVYTLVYDFTLRNDAAVDIMNTKYDVELYIDTSVDGRFSDIEKIPSLTVKEQTSSGWVQVFHNDKGKYELVAGKTYQVSRIVPSGYSGVLSWKLVFSQNDSPMIRKAETGFTKIPATEKTDIKILQITSSDGSNNLDLSTNATVRRLLNQINEFNVIVTTQRSDQYINSNSGTSEAEYLEYLNNYDMLIFGFADCYKFGDESSNNAAYKNKVKNAANAINRYIESGKSVLFTHDTTSHYYRAKQSNDSQYYWGRAFNEYVRSTVGMDRFGVLSESTSVVNDYYSVAKTEPVKLTQGFSDTYVNGNDGRTSSNVHRFSTRSVLIESNFDKRVGNLLSNYKVTALNDGQILHYPFEIPESFTVSNTHGQYFQLNLDTNPDDSIIGDDVVVWYTLSDADGLNSDDVYQANPADARNNYYIYNKGNVTYSGAGHSTVTGEDEIKLFINTMVAAYSAGVHAPTVTYMVGESEAFATDSAYVPFDYGTGEAIDGDSVKIYFEVSDTTFVQGSRKLNVKYYIEDENGTEIESNGVIYKVKEITPTITKGNEPLTDIHCPDLDTRYTMKVSMDTISAITTDQLRIFISAETSYTMASGEKISTGEAYYGVELIKIKLFDLD